jgi:hypothetical protein
MATRKPPRDAKSDRQVAKSDQRVAASATPPAEQPAPEDIRRRIEMHAYFKAKARGFAPGYELQDWLEAEREVRDLNR